MRLSIRTSISEPLDNRSSLPCFRDGFGFAAPSHESAPLGKASALARPFTPVSMPTSPYTPRFVTEMSDFTAAATVHGTHRQVEAYVGKNEMSGVQPSKTTKPQKKRKQSLQHQSDPVSDDAKKSKNEKEEGRRDRHTSLIKQLEIGAERNGANYERDGHVKLNSHNAETLKFSKEATLNYSVQFVNKLPEMVERVNELEAKRTAEEDRGRSQRQLALGFMTLQDTVSNLQQQAPGHADVCILLQAVRRLRVRIEALLNDSGMEEASVVWTHVQQLHDRAASILSGF